MRREGTGKTCDKKEGGEEGEGKVRTVKFHMKRKLKVVVGRNK